MKPATLRSRRQRLRAQGGPLCPAAKGDIAIVEHVHRGASILGQCQTWKSYMPGLVLRTDRLGHVKEVRGPLGTVVRICGEMVTIIPQEIISAPIEEVLEVLPEGFESLDEARRVLAPWTA